MQCPRNTWMAALLLLPSLAAQPSAAPVVIGEKVRIQSKILNGTRSLLIAKPAGYEEGADKYPVLYLLDGESQFVHAAGIVRFLAESERIPGMLVVAIENPGYAERTHDLTPKSTAEIDNRFSPGNGGAGEYLRFLSEELLPYVDRSYRTRPYRILAGHSFGGLFAIHSLLDRPALFNAYIAIDPTLSWDNQAEVSRAEAFFARTPDLDAGLYIAAANDGGGVPAGTRKFAAVLDEHTPKGLRWNFVWMPEETHSSISHRALYAGLDNIFDGWHLADPLALYDQGGLEAVHRHFREGGKRCGYDVQTSPFTISMIVYELGKAGRLEEAAAVLLHDPKAYPPPWNQLDALARKYAGRGDRPHAIEYFELSLERNPNNEYARAKLVELAAPEAAQP